MSRYATPWANEPPLCKARLPIRICGKRRIIHLSAAYIEIYSSIGDEKRTRLGPSRRGARHRGEIGAMLDRVCWHMHLPMSSETHPRGRRHNSQKKPRQTDGAQLRKTKFGGWSRLMQNDQTSIVNLPIRGRHYNVGTVRGTMKSPVTCRWRG
jgi:hypothetical protein